MKKIFFALVSINAPDKKIKMSDLLKIETVNILMGDTDNPDIDEGKHFLDMNISK